WIDETKNLDWSIGICQVVHAMNISYCRGIKTTPYEAVFGCPHKLASITNDLLNDFNILNEEDIEKIIELPDYIEDLDDLEFD
ncbi:9087_t:CDS:1, partial [Gigaspora rosea]